MNCPNCKNRLVEAQTACDACGFNMAAADEWFGSLPAPGPGLIDASQALTREQEIRIKKAFATIRQHFPQVRVHGLLLNLPQETDLATCIFWLFNCGGFCQPQESGGKHDVLLMLDIANRRAACMVGYGLEPFLEPGVLDQVAWVMKEHLMGNRPAEALLAATDHLVIVLQRSHARAIHGLGLAGREFVPSPSSNPDAI